MNNSSTSFSSHNPLVVVTQHAIRYLKLNISDDTVIDSLLKHPDYPNVSSLSDALSRLKIENKAVRINSSQLLELEPFFFAYVLNHGLVFVKEISGGTIQYFSPISGEVSESLEMFNQKWTGVTLLFDQSGAVKEKDFRQKSWTRKLKGTRFPVSMFLLFFLLVLIFLHTGFNVPVFLFFIKLLGIAICAFLSMLLIKNETNFFKFCNLGTRYSCNDVLKSPASKLFNWLSFSDIGLVYFAGGLLSIFISILINHTFSIIVTLAILTAPALPYTFYSIYYQVFIVKKWCLLCLAVLGLIWTEAALFVLYINDIGLAIPDTTAVTITLFSFISVMLAWSYLKETILESVLLKDYKYQFYRLSNNKDVFEVLHNKKAIVNTEFKSNHISIGNGNAKNKILLVLNPFCESCAKEFDQLLDLHKKESDNINVSFVLSGNSIQESGEVNDISIFIIELYYQLEEFEFCKALSNWFKNKDFEELKRQYQFGCSDKAIKTYREHLLWLQQTGIIQTPALFFNSRRLSDYYSVEQLSYSLL